MAPRVISDTGTFDAADETSATIESRVVDIGIVDAGSFSGTIVGYKKVLGNDVQIFSITESDLPYEKVAEPATQEGIYLKCTARSAGSANYYMSGQ